MWWHRTIQKARLIIFGYRRTEIGIGSIRHIDRLSKPSVDRLITNRRIMRNHWQQALSLYGLRVSVLKYSRNVGIRSIFCVRLLIRLPAYAEPGR